MNAPRVEEGPWHSLRSAEVRRFSVGIRAIMALLCTLLLVVTFDQTVGAGPMAVMLVYGLWSGWLLLREASGHSREAPLWHSWIDVAWSVLMMKLLSVGSAMFTLTLVHPVVMVSIGYGVNQGLLLAGFAAAGMLVDGGSGIVRNISAGWLERTPALLVLALVPSAAMIARPISLLRRRLALVATFSAEIDPRRGLEAICSELVERLRSNAEADVVALVLPASLDSPAMVASRGDGRFRMGSAAHAKLEALLAPMPDGPMSYFKRRWWDPRRRVRLHATSADSVDVSGALAALATELEVNSLHVVPLTRYARPHGCFVVGYAKHAGASWDAPALAAMAPELLRIVEQAALVDQLQEETASHERARIGRDLHDSAIQPYLGLKYAVETVALRIAADNPARADIDALASMVNGEVLALRELISGLRSGAEPGDSALVPAVRRQVRRFALLFGIDVQLDCPDDLPTTRALASALFHIINEALTNVRKHSAAQRVWITLAMESGDVRLLITDDAGTQRGRAYDDFQPGSLSERVAELCGTLHISRPDGINTVLQIDIPVR